MCNVETYLQPAAKKYYANRGVPYRRVSLFYGPPGTGKTTFANVIAGHFRLNVFMVSLSTTTLSDDMLEPLFEQLPDKCILLLEDIDSAGTNRQNMGQKAKGKKAKRADQHNEIGEPIAPRLTGITLSGLLNVLDGIHSRKGMITISHRTHQTCSISSCAPRPYGSESALQLRVEGREQWEKPEGGGEGENKP